MAMDVLDPEKDRVAYSAYQPQAFDESGGEPPGGPAGLPAPRAPEAEDFERAHEPEAHEEGRFEEKREQFPPGETDFASIKFQRENTLLTNAESYAASIREEAELYVRQLRAEAEALEHETQQRYEEARAAKEEAQAEAERIVAEAEARSEEVHQQAHQEGFEAGREEGQRQRYEEAGVHLERLEAIMAEAEQFRDRLTFYTEKDGVRLALLMAKQILRAELKVNKQVVLRLLASTLAKLQGQGTFRVWLNPEDHRFALAARPKLERFLDEDQTLSLRSRPDLPAGNILIETDREVIDLTFQSQFYHLERMLNQHLAERETVLTQRHGPNASASRPRRAPPGTSASRPRSTPAGEAPDTPEPGSD